MPLKADTERQKDTQTAKQESGQQQKRKKKRQEKRNKYKTYTKKGLTDINGDMT